MAKVKRVPVMMQMEATECGAICLAMVLAYHGKWLSLEQIRADCGVSRDGSNAKNIIKAARAYGLDAQGLRMEPEDLKDIACPAIIHWNFNHFVVLNGFKRDKAIINDPSRGKIKVPLDEFDKAFTGVVLRLKKSDSFKSKGKPQSVVGFVKKRLKGAFMPFVFVMLIGTLSAIIRAVIPLFSRIFIDDILSGKNLEWLIPLISAFGIALIFQFIVAILDALYWFKMEGRFAIMANVQYMWHVLNLPMEFFSQRFVGDIVSRQIINQQIAGTLIRKLAPILVNIFLIMIYLLIMINYSIILTMISVAIIIINIFVMHISAMKQTDLSRVAQASGGSLAGATMNGIELIETIKASGAENGFFEHWAGYYARQHNAHVAISKSTQYFDAIPAFLQQIANVIILMTGVRLILSGDFTIGMLLTFQGFVFSFLTPINQLAQLGQDLIIMRSSMERVEDVFRYQSDALEEEEYSKGKELLDKLSGAIEINDITFGYCKLSEPLIRNFSLSIRPGSTIALVGGSGSGKSTLAKLIAGLYRPWAGEILFDGQKRENIPSYIFRSSVAMVDQEIILFEDTVANNIRMWDASIEDFAVILAARDADIHDTIISRPNGYAHVIQEGGRDLSGGQRQCLEIARVLAQEPTIIILDEATSALDAKTERQVMKNIKNIGVVCIVIAHRLSTIQECDEIIVMDKGLVAEHGTHEELFNMDGIYARLVSSE